MPIEQPHVEKTRAKQVIFLHVEVTREEMGRAIHGALSEIGGALQARNVAPTGPWFAHHHRRPTNTFDVDVCFPVGEALVVSRPLQTVLLPEEEVAHTVYNGAYEGLPAAWPEFLAWFAEQGYAMRGDFYEVYRRGPRESNDATSWQTDLMIPLQNATSKEPTL